MLRSPTTFLHLEFNRLDQGQEELTDSFLRLIYWMDSSRLPGMGFQVSGASPSF
jgi:hypothetical protein